MAKSVRIDVLLVERGLVDSREKARRLIMAGHVRVENRPNLKPGDKIPVEAEITLLEPPKYVGRGGLKLETALDAFGIDPSGMTCLDVGASTGGFTDCLLQRGASRVHAIDVGHDQLDWKIRSDPRVVVQEGCNARYLKNEMIGELVDLVVIDVSFISLTLILQPVAAVLQPEGMVVALIKPQFELSSAEVGKGGVVRDEAARERAIEKIRAFCVEIPFGWRGCVPSAITGATGNQEYLAWLQKPSAS